ncbi:hypothetical protein [Pseudomonas subflava]|uniref:hypothetical protein n=1 Tax=Pseudomonas subflava TaxID=2952933 RepID=UPI002079BB5F|nr:hypothetical protein [Pseudomonas subflava]
MGLVYHADFEVPLWLDEDPLQLKVLCHGRQIVSVCVLFGDVIQAMYYPNAPFVHGPETLERLCRLAIAQFQQSNLHLFRRERSDAPRRPAYLLDLGAIPYEGVLLSHTPGAAPPAMLGMSASQPL